MKKKYERPVAEKTLFLTEDIITVSVQESGIAFEFDYNDADYDGAPDF